MWDELKLGFCFGTEIFLYFIEFLLKLLYFDSLNIIHFYQKLVNGDMKNVNFEQFNCFEFFQLFAHFVTDCVPSIKSIILIDSQFN